MTAPDEGTFMVLTAVPETVPEKTSPSSSFEESREDGVEGREAIGETLLLLVMALPV